VVSEWMLWVWEGSGCRGLKGCDIDMDIGYVVYGYIVV
jgi:hypothetical protein